MNGLHKVIKLSALVKENTSSTQSRLKEGGASMLPKKWEGNDKNINKKVRLDDVDDTPTQQSYVIDFFIK